MYHDIGFYDWQTVLSLVEALAWAAVVGVLFLVLLEVKAKQFTKQKKQIIWAVFAAWAVASSGLAIISTYDYFNSQREDMKQSIRQQHDQYGED